MLWCFVVTLRLEELQSIAVGMSVHMHSSKTLCPNHIILYISDFFAVVQLMTVQYFMYFGFVQDVMFLRNRVCTHTHTFRHIYHEYPDF